MIVLGVCGVPALAGAGERLVVRSLALTSPLAAGAFTGWDSARLPLPTRRIWPADTSLLAAPCIFRSQRSSPQRSSPQQS